MAYDVQLDRQGNPVSPSAAYLQRAPKLSGGTVLQGPGAEPVPELQPITGYRADAQSWARNMEAYDLCQLLDLWLRRQGASFTVDLTAAEHATLPGDVRRHFMPVRGASNVKHPDPEGDEREQLRQQLVDLGIDVDGRWGLQRLRDELEAATAPAPGMRA